MASRKAVFLDVDGTLVNELGRVPDSSRRAVREARANGHLVFVCTGRSHAELWPEIVEIGFDGFITGAGAHVQAGDDVLVDHHLPEDALRHIADFFGPLDVPFYFQAKDGIYATGDVRAQLRSVVAASVTDPDVLAALEVGLFGFIDEIQVSSDPFSAHVSKAIYLDSTVPLELIQAEFAGVLEVIRSSVTIFGENSGEMMIPGVHKATGIEVMIRHLGIDRADTIAIGDSYNDLEMLAHVAVGIAMGDAPDAVQDVADEVTAGVDELGIHLAFLRHGLIGD